MLDGLDSGNITIALELTDNYAVFHKDLKLDQLDVLVNLIINQIEDNEFHFKKQLFEFKSMLLQIKI